MFISIGFYKNFEDELLKAFGGDEKKMQNFQEEIATSFADMIHVTRDQIRTVFSREGVSYIDIAFIIILEREKFHVEIFAFPIEDVVPIKEVDHITILIPLLENAITIPWKVNLDHTQHASSWAMDAGQRFAADFGREGLPSDMKKNIAELARVLKKAKSPKYYPYPHWMNL